MSNAAFTMPEHSHRAALNDEVHARPPVRLEGSWQVVYLAVRHAPHERAAHRDGFRGIAKGHGAEVPVGADHGIVSGPAGLLLKWEGHSEFTGYTFFAPGCRNETPEALLDRAGWSMAATSLPGEVFVAVSLDLVPFEGTSPPSKAFESDAPTILGGAIAEGNAWAYTDLRIREDGFTRFLVLNRAMGPGQAGRMVQRLLEIETYRMMALLAFPVARGCASRLAELEGALRALVERISAAKSEDEASLLDDLTRLAVRVEHLQSETGFRFEASEAYEALVARRLQELRELRLPGLSPIEEFLNRRLAPAMATCRSTSRRIANLAARLARASAMLRTRVDIAREVQNQQLLAAMNRRGRLQLRLQQAVEGLSVVVITYYGVSLAGVLAKAAVAAGWNNIDPDITMGLVAPIMAGSVFFIARRARRALTREEGTA